MIHSRQIIVAGQAIILHGRQGDSYFDNAAPDVPLLWALDNLAAGDVVLDIGANVGMTAVAAAMRGAVVHAFEPDPSVFPSLRETIKANDGSVIAHNIALGSEEGTLSFFSNPVSASASHLVTAATLGQTEGRSVPVSTVDLFAEQRGVDRINLIKIDVEGFEIDVLRGAMRSIEKYRPRALVEFNAFTMIGFRDINPRDLLRTLRSTFPHVYRFVGGRPLPIDSDDAALSFIHDNLVSAGCVDDLYCSFS